jgi:hypothetical protein
MSYMDQKRKRSERKRGGQLRNQNARKQNPFKPYEMDLDLRDVNKIVEMTEKLGKLVLAQKIPFQAMQVINGGISNILRIYCPAGVTAEKETVPGPRAVNLQELMRSLHGLPLDIQDMVVNALKGERVKQVPRSRAQS